MTSRTEIFDNLAFRLTHKLVSHPLFNQYFNSIEDFKELTGFEAHELNDLFSLSDQQLEEHFEKIGNRLFQNYHPPFIDVSQFLGFAAGELITMLNKSDQNFDTTRVSELYHLVQNSIARSYFYMSLDNISLLASQSHQDDLSPLSIHFRWLEQVTRFLSGAVDESPESDHLSCEFAHWLDRMESELLLASAGTERTEYQAKIYLTHRIIHQQLTYVIAFTREKAFALAFSHMEFLYQSVLELDQLIRSLQLTYIENEEYKFYDYIDQKAAEAESLYYFISLKIKHKQAHAPSFKKLVFHELQDIRRQLCVLLRSSRLDGVMLLYDNQISLFFQQNKGHSEPQVVQFIKDEIHASIQSMANRSGFSVSSIGIRMDALSSYQEYRVAILRQLENYHADNEFIYFSDQDAEKLYHYTVESKRLAALAANALEQDRLEVFYQPIVHKQEPSMLYVEALVRAPSEDGYLAAEQFIHFLEKENKMIELDLLVMRHIHQSIPRLSRVVDKISMNIYPTSFSEPEIIQGIIDLNLALQAASMTLVVEITEYLFMHDVSRVEKLATEHGIMFAMDDFGSGYSNLLQLIEFSERGIIEILKVDGSIVEKISTNETVFMILQTIIQIAQILKMTPIVMEYVHNEEIHRKLDSLDIPLYYQGFYFSEPLSLDGLEKRHSNNSTH